MTTDDLQIDDSAFEPFFTREETLEQHCQLLENEMAELNDELKASREKIATLVTMWSGVSAELARVEGELAQAKGALWELEQSKAPVGVVAREG